VRSLEGGVREIEEEREKLESKFSGGRAQALYTRVTLLLSGHVSFVKTS
jgi:hypothetical protein